MASLMPITEADAESDADGRAPTPKPRRSDSDSDAGVGHRRRRSGVGSASGSASASAVAHRHRPRVNLHAKRVVRRFCFPARTRKNPARASGVCATSRGALSRFFRLGGMQAKPTHHPPSRFLVLDLAIHAIEVLRPTVTRIRRYDRDLGEQLRTALSPPARNIAEGNGSQDGHRVARFCTAAVSRLSKPDLLELDQLLGHKLNP